MVTLAIWLCTIPPSVALLYYSLEVVWGLFPFRFSPAPTGEVRTVIVIPAHDEALLIEQTVREARRGISPSTQVLVVADNCSDRTAEYARAAGATVIERSDRSRRGKGFALAFAREFLRSDPPDAVFILDADCRIALGSAENVGRHSVFLGEPVQSANLLTAPKDASALVLLSNFAMLIKNLTRARGLYRLGGGITLFGTGMVFPWTVFAQLDLASSIAVEDLALALSLASKGVKVHLSEQLLVTSAAAELGDSLDQRARWEHGFLAQAFKRGLPLLGSGVARRSRHLLALGAHMLVPPLALLLVLAVIALIPAYALAFIVHSNGPAVLITSALGCAVVTTGLAWYLEGRTTLPLGALLRAPLYVVWKVPLYLRFIVSRQSRWNRTRRANEKD